MRGFVGEVEEADTGLDTTERTGSDDFVVEAAVEAECASVDAVRTGPAREAYIVLPEM